jgi:hypothetical protein
MWTKAQDWPARKPAEGEQHKIAGAIVVEHLESHNWKIEHGPPLEGHGPHLMRFPAPWRADKMPGGYVVRDANGQALVYV